MKKIFPTPRSTPREKYKLDRDINLSPIFCLGRMRSSGQAVNEARLQTCTDSNEYRSIPAAPRIVLLEIGFTAQRDPRRRQRTRFGAETGLCYG
ncbi:hypothetical protein [Parasphingopyxis marina]|uniref:Uncharacterized protein n=1 Tax=Parasphingopyxis marina TaxID=2761622 RepID=A0A842HZ94_9SPHN|nr:hypothetical protein [Parasphingopyxis marina]MBC2778506.1 hypothetical protein [Parasphingopyxis marina]